MPHPLKIALVGPAYPYRGGIAHFTETMYDGLQARGHDVAAVTFTTQYPDLLFPGKTQYETATVPEPVPAIRLLSSIGPWSWRRTAHHLIAQQPDAVVFMHWMPFFAPAFGTIARSLQRHGIRTLAVVHNALPHERRLGDVPLSAYFLRACDGFVVMSEAVEHDLERLEVRAPVRRVPHPIYTRFGEAVPKAEARERFGLPPDAPVLLFFGFIRRYKGLHVLLEAMSHLVPTRPQLRLIVAGEFYEDEAPYRALMRQHRLGSHVLLQATYIPDEEVALYFSAADVVVQPYVSATQSGVAQIAYHFRKPLIVTDVGGLGEIVPHEQAGFVVPPDDPERLAAAIDRFFAEGWAARLQTGIEAQCERFSWDRLYEALEGLICRPGAARS
jgi:glycosyltransferase involved in cell wall biosynthesis